MRIVSLTVTEKGYCHTPQTGDLDERHPDIVHDLEQSRRAALGARLHRGRAGAPAGAGVAPFTVLCCDNLPPTATPCSGS